MKTCVQCKTKFPATLVVDGKRRNLSHRKYCFTCSPFGKHNTRPIGYVRLKGTPHTCPGCKKAHSGKCTLCASCCTNRRRFKIKEKAVRYLGGKCQKCGYSKCIAALTFHHRDPSQKDFQIGGNHSRSWSAIQAELDKCDLLCANCHAEYHYTEEMAEGSGHDPHPG